MNELKQLPARFFESDIGNVPVREWLLSLTQKDREIIGDNIRTAEFGWPVGMPLCRSMKGIKGFGRSGAPFQAVGFPVFSSASIKDQ